MSLSLIFLFGVFLGANVGILASCLCVAGGDN